MTTDVGSTAKVEKELRDLARIAPVNSHDVLDRTLSLVRGHLDLDLVLVTEIVGDKEIVLDAEGDEAVLEEVATVDDDVETVIVLDDDLPKETDAEGPSCVMEVPLRFSDGRVFGSLCCMSRESREIDTSERRFVKVLARLVTDQLEREELLERNSQLHLEQNALEVLLAALAARDGYTSEHSQEVVELSLAVADAMNISGRSRDLVQQTALLHDVGKIGIPDHILRKEGPLDETEWEIMKTHPEVGQRIVESTVTLRHLGLSIRAEHERWDGQGYPDGLRGQEIPLASRIVFVCDAFHAMVSDRPYRRRMPRADACARLLAESGRQFDPRCVDALFEIVSRDKTPNGDEPPPGRAYLDRSSALTILADVQEETMVPRADAMARSDHLRRELEEVLEQLGDSEG